MQAEESPLIRTRPGKDVLVRLLTSKGLLPRQEAGRDEAGLVVHRRSGFVLEKTEHPPGWRVSYVHDEGDELSEGRFHDQIRQLVRDGGMEAVTIDAPACRNVGVQVSAVRPLATEDRRLLIAVDQARVTKQRGRWVDSGPLGGSPLDTRPLSGLVANGLVEGAADGNTAVLTSAGRALLHRQADSSNGVPAIDLSEFL
ncbi:hypothetical protein [Kitasatospora sp. MBT63]|uniref:hypothetical protein n=1 Tax=Kitasatospora sp. MBT63 TaxID=1444768 RepID=UPI0005399307|nr:hypothetical protein [Kitasatospora sp. MBT63]